MKSKLQRKCMISELQKSATGKKSNYLEQSCITRAHRSVLEKYRLVKNKGNESIIHNNKYIHII